MRLAWPIVRELLLDPDGGLLGIVDGCEHQQAEDFGWCGSQLVAELLKPGTVLDQQANGDVSRESRSGIGQRVLHNLI